MLFIKVLLLKQRIEGLIRVSHTGKYIFKLDSDGESFLFFQNIKIIDKNIRDLDWDNDGLSRF